MTIFQQLINNESGTLNKIDIVNINIDIIYQMTVLKKKKFKFHENQKNNVMKLIKFQFIHCYIM